MATAIVPPVWALFDEDSRDAHRRRTAEEYSWPADPRLFRPGERPAPSRDEIREKMPQESAHSTGPTLTADTPRRRCERRCVLRCQLPLIPSPASEAEPDMVPDQGDRRRLRRGASVGAGHRPCRGSVVFRALHPSPRQGARACPGGPLGAQDAEPEPAPARGLPQSGTRPGHTRRHRAQADRPPHGAGGLHTRVRSRAFVFAGCSRRGSTGHRHLSRHPQNGLVPVVCGCQDGGRPTGSSRRVPGARVARKRSDRRVAS